MTAPNYFHRFKLECTWWVKTKLIIASLNYFTYLGKRFFACLGFSNVKRCCLFNKVQSNKNICCNTFECVQMFSCFVNWNIPYIQTIRLLLVPTELIHQVAPLCNSGRMPSTARVPLSCYAAFIHYTQHLLTHTVDMPYIYNTWS